MKQTEHSFDNTERGRLLFSPGMKLADLVESNYELLVVLARMGIPLGFGESSVGEVCRQRGISAELFLMICRIYSSEVPVLPYEQLTSDDLGGVLDYLHTSHLYYLEVTLPHLDAKMAAMTATCDGVHSKILSTFFADYRREVDNHFDYEERTVFPYVQALLEKRRVDGYNILCFEDNHSDIDGKLCDLKNIIIKYLPEKLFRQAALRSALRYFPLRGGPQPTYRHRESDLDSVGRKIEKMDNGRIYKVLIIEPSAIVGAGIRTLLDGFSEFRALDAETTGDPATCFERVATTGPDLVLINPALFPVMRRTPIRNAFPMLQDVPIIALCHGAVDDELLHEFDGVINLYDSPGRVHHKLRQALEQTRTTAQPEGELSEREREILVAVARGLTNREIADQYFISIHTVISHRKNITRKTGIKTIAGLTVYALLNNI